MIHVLLSPAVLLWPLHGALLGPSDPPSPAPGKDVLGPPGLVAIRGGTTATGADPKEIQALVHDVSSASANLRALDAETPQSRTSVPEFFMGLTELTQEQYAVYVRDTNSRPLQDWGSAAIEAGRLRWFEEMNEINKQRKAEGKPALREKFDAGAWWEENWSDSQWELPQALALRPVAHVDYKDTQAYCRWGGVRLPTELEYQHAVRGSGKSMYPWGDEWEDGKYCATNEIKGHPESFQVANFDAGKSKDGLFDLAGNVWEWTSSPYVPLKNFKKNKYKVGKKSVQVEPRWDGNQRVVVGGSFQNSHLVARCTVRRPTERTQATNAMGFRVAASTRPGVDMAHTLYNSDIRNSDFRPDGVTYEPNLVVAMDRWESEAGHADAPAGYELIAGYEFLLFTPVIKLDQTQDADFRRESLEDIRHLGFISTDVPILEPALDRGTYLVAFRAAGEPPAAKISEEGDDEEDPAEDQDLEEDPYLSQLDIEQDNLLIIDLKNGELKHASPIVGVVFNKGEAGGSWAQIVKTHMEPDPNNPKEEVEIAEDWLRCEVRLETKIRRRCLNFAIELKPDPSFFARKWRR